MRENKVCSWIQYISGISDDYLIANWQSHLKSAKGTPIKEEETAFVLRPAASLAFLSEKLTGTQLRRSA